MKPSCYRQIAMVGLGSLWSWLLLTHFLDLSAKAQVGLDPISLCMHELLYQPSFSLSPEMNSTRTEVSIAQAQQACQRVRTNLEAERVSNCLNSLLYGSQVGNNSGWRFERTTVTVASALQSCQAKVTTARSVPTVVFNDTNTQSLPAEELSARLNDYLLRGDRQYQQQNYSEAIAMYSQAIETAPFEARAYNSRATARYQNEDYSGAMADYDRALAIDPQSAHGYYGRGYLKQTLQDYWGAIRDYNRTLEIDANFSLAYRNRGLAYLNLNRPRRAIADLQVAASLLRKSGNTKAYREVRTLIRNLTS